MTPDNEEVTRPEGPATPVDPIAAGRHRAEIVTAMRELAEASREVKILFDRLDLALQRAVTAVEAGTNSLELARSMNLPGRREALDEAARRARDGQRALLRALFRAAEAEGATKADIARTWRVSRQLVSRIVRGTG